MSESRFTVENRVGRLIEARVYRLTTPADADAYGAAVAAETLKRESPNAPVLCADHRHASVYPPAVADRLIELFVPNNRRFDRIAILVSPKNATLLMQLERLTREAGFEHRKVFREPAGAILFLSSSLEQSEVSRMTAFLAETPRPPSTRLVIPDGG